ncbi:MAG: PfkB family carbohydrate kinase, partial [Pseudomonadota bacterium]
ESGSVARASIVLLQNEIPPEINLVAARAARNAGATVLWNAAPMRKDTERFIGLVDLLIVNAVEAEQFCGQKVGSLEEAERAARRLCSDGTNTIVTAGAAGCAWATKEGDLGALPAEPVKEANAHGAGDVFCGALAARLVERSLRESLAFAMAKAHRHVSGLPLV